jgi:hypothetical protein
MKGNTNIWWSINIGFPEFFPSNQLRDLYSQSCQQNFKTVPHRLDLKLVDPQRFKLSNHEHYIYIETTYIYTHIIPIYTSFIVIISNIYIYNERYWASCSIGSSRWFVLASRMAKVLEMTRWVKLDLWKITIFNGLINYFYGHGFNVANSKRLPGRVVLFFVFYGVIML